MENICTTSVPNYSSFDFFDPKFDHSSYSKKFVQMSSNLSQSWRTSINKASHNKRSDILHKFLNKTSGQTLGQKCQTIYNLTSWMLVDYRELQDNLTSWMLVVKRFIICYGVDGFKRINETW